ncbi:hypothetical protein FIBSPDRAFT_991017 [Athelia psychrophila]|uniref:Uncharacterized protein n=1 Tax=Athelia psychrophila TaxID=1759441 RepID=A0A165ZBJ5_9AGAM|nr:hypothetical protein FIBSPDRAFT_991017 [Fibularhizoctonia sp. CBS 109695]
MKKVKEKGAVRDGVDKIPKNSEKIYQYIKQTGYERMYNELGMMRADETKRRRAVGGAAGDNECKPRRDGAAGKCNWLRAGNHRSRAAGGRSQKQGGGRMAQWRVRRVKQEVGGGRKGSVQVGSGKGARAPQAKWARKRGGSKGVGKQGSLQIEAREGWPLASAKEARSAGGRKRSSTDEQAQAGTDRDQGANEAGPCWQMQQNI